MHQILVSFNTHNASLTFFCFQILHIKRRPSGICNIQVLVNVFRMTQSSHAWYCNPRLVIKEAHNDTYNSQKYFNAELQTHSQAHLHTHHDKHTKQTYLMIQWLMTACRMLFVDGHIHCTHGLLKSCDLKKIWSHKLFPEFIHSSLIELFIRYLAHTYLSHTNLPTSLLHH